jgi:hypothetical protein
MSLQPCLKTFIAREFVEVATGMGSDALERRPPLLRQALAGGKKVKCSVGSSTGSLATSTFAASQGRPIPFMLHIYTALTEQEHTLISQRSKAALATAIRRSGGRPLGSSGAFRGQVMPIG